MQLPIISYSHRTFPLALKIFSLSCVLLNNHCMYSFPALILDITVLREISKRINGAENDAKKNNWKGRTMQCCKTCELDEEIKCGIYAEQMKMTISDKLSLVCNISVSKGWTIYENFYENFKSIHVYNLWTMSQAKTFLGESKIEEKKKMRNET